MAKDLEAVVYIGPAVTRQNVENWLEEANLDTSESNIDKIMEALYNKYSSDDHSDEIDDAIDTVATELGFNK